LAFGDTKKGRIDLRKHLDDYHRDLDLNAINADWPGQYHRWTRCAQCDSHISAWGTAITNHVKSCIGSFDPAISRGLRYREFFPDYDFDDAGKRDAYVIERPGEILNPIPGPQVAPNRNLVNPPNRARPVAQNVPRNVPNREIVLPVANAEIPNFLVAPNPNNPIPIPIRRGQGGQRAPRNPVNRVNVAANAENQVENVNEPARGMHGFDFMFQDEPSDAQLEELDRISSDLSDGCFYMHHGQKIHFKDLVDTLLRIHLDAAADVCLRKLAVYALLILPGLFVRLQRVKTESLGNVFREMNESVSPVLAVLIRARQTLLVYPRRQSRGGAHLTKAKVDDLLKAQRLGSLMSALQSEADGQHAATKSVQELRELTAEFHPVGDEHDDIDDIVAPPGTEVANLSAEDLARAITKLPMGSAAGASGWTFHLIRILYEGEASRIVGGHAVNENVGVGLLKRMLSTITMGTVDPFVLRKLNTSRLQYIPKTSGGDRPIAIGDSLLRLLLRVLNAKYAPDVGRLLEPLQVAVGTSGGCEVMAAMAQETFSLDNYTLALDLHSAFNQVWRRAIAEGLREHAPFLLPIFKLLYGRASELRANAREGRAMFVGLSSRGCKQGDPLSMLYFAVAIHAWLRSVNEIVIARHAVAAPDITPSTMAYADDIALGGDPTVLCACLPVITDSLLATTGLHVTVNKCKLLGAAEFAPPEEGPVIPVVHNGAVLVGVPIGTQGYQRSESSRLLTKAARCASIVSESPLVSSQGKFALLSNCVNAKPQYLCRNIHPSIIEDSIRTFDRAIDRSLESILGARMDPSRAQLRGLPFSHSGCGMRRFQGSESINSYNARNKLVAAFLGRFNQDVPVMQGVLDAMSAREPVPYVHHDPMYHPVSSLREEHNILLKMVLSNIEQEEHDGPAKAAWLKSGVNLGSSDTTYSASGKFLQWSGGQDMRWYMTNNVFASALRRRLCFTEANSPLACPHTDLHNPRGSHVDLSECFGHLLVCRVGTPFAIKKRHDWITDSLFHLISKCLPDNVPVPIPAHLLAREIDVGNRPNGTVIKSDIVFMENANLPNQTRIVIDVTVVEPFNRHGVGRVEAGGAVEAAAIAKVIDYAPVTAQANVHFVPFALDSNGHFGTHATAFLNRLKLSNPTIGTCIKHFIQEVSHHLAKRTAIASEAGRSAAYHAVWR
jgi:hypothetical protein